MFITYHSNQLEVLFGLLNHQLQHHLADPFIADVILVQSPGMAQWLQLKIAEKNGISANLAFPMPAAFLWQQYAQNLPNVSQQTPFQKDAMAWRLIRLIPKFLDLPNFHNLAHYLHHAKQSNQEKLYQLAYKIADLFDQYLVYRPDWITAWEKHDDAYITQQLLNNKNQENNELCSQIENDINWQGQLWRALLQDIESQSEQNIPHRANLHRNYLAALAQNKIKKLPTRLFIFGISAMPKVYLESFMAISQHIDVHCFFNNPSCHYWADLVDETFIQKLRMKERTAHLSQTKSSLLSAQQLDCIEQQQFDPCQTQELLVSGNPLLAAWGKQGRDFLYLLTETQGQEIEAFVQPSGKSLLAQLQRAILNLSPSQPNSLHWQQSPDLSLCFSACYSPMREVEVLHDFLLNLFQKDPSLTPKDVVVMMSDIDKYQPYIEAVFSQYRDNRYIPFSIADTQLSSTDALIASFLNLFTLKNSQFSAEDVLELLDIPAIRAAFSIDWEDLEKLRIWVKQVGIRFGLNHIEIEGISYNYNAWQAGLERMLLGIAMREENGLWQDSLGFDASHGSQAQLIGYLCEFIQQLYDWQQFLQQPHFVEDWKTQLLAILNKFFIQNNETQATLVYIQQAIEELQQMLQEVQFEHELETEVVVQALQEKLDKNQQSLKFLVGKVSFCTLLPMRAIPFRVVCLLGMNETSYPRQQQVNSFDLMQYHSQKGDRSRRNDDRYLFLEALLAAQDYFYLSYVGRSLVDNQEMAPSVLVSQLLDYLIENLDIPALEGETEPERQQRLLKLLVSQESMRIFSPQNFHPASNQNVARKWQSFAKQWQPNWLKNNMLPDDFGQALGIDCQESVSELELSQLVQFIQNPVRFFFEKRLGVYFSKDKDLIADSESFDLNALDKYLIKDELLNVEEHQQALFFEKLKVKGLLPHGEFAHIEKQTLIEEIKPFQTKISPYLHQQASNQIVKLDLDCPSGAIRLHANLGHFYDTPIRAVYWSLSTLKDQHVIQYWLAYLLQLATQLSSRPPIFYHKDKCCSFNELSPAQALAQLSIYVDSYRRGLNQLQIVPTKGIQAYLDTINSIPINLHKQKQLLQDNAYKEVFGRPAEQDFYWQRLLIQTTELDLPHINAQVESWFGLMQQSLISLDN